MFHTPHGANKKKGFTLIELIISLCILSLLALGSINLTVDLIQQQNAKTVQNLLISAVSATRQTAIAYHQPATLCPTHDRKTCVNSWGETWMLFYGTDDAGQCGEHSTLLKIFHPKVKGTLVFNAYPNSDYVRFSQLGYTDYQNGTFIYSNKKINWKMIINQSGNIL